jgi:hypothetical protein
MALGKEYRTTERYNGKAVYCKLFNYGSLPNTTTLDIEHNIADATMMFVDLSKTRIYSETTGYETVNLSPLNGSIDGLFTTVNGEGKRVVRITTSGNLSDFKVHVCLKYTKD